MIVNILRFGSRFPKTLDNGDRYDSLLTLETDDGLEIRSFEWLNTDYSSSYIGKGGIVAEGQYDWIAGIFKNKYLALRICRNLTDDQDWNELSYSQITLDSLIPNPNHGGKKIITDVWAHKGGRLSDGSQGCQTLFPDDWDDFIKYFSLNDRGRLYLKRGDGPVPDFYKE